jgi:hypothetical protein
LSLRDGIDLPVVPMIDIIAEKAEATASAIERPLFNSNICSGLLFQKCVVSGATPGLNLG